MAGAGILQRWLPTVPLWLMSLVLLLLMTATNLFSVRSYGEFEFWFAGIKVAAIFVFLVLGGLFVLGLWPGHSLDFSNLTAHGGFFPNGVGAIFSGIVVVIFSMVGAEIATDRRRRVRRPGARRSPRRPTRSSCASRSSSSARSSCWRSSCPGTPRSSGPRRTSRAFETMGIPAAADIMNAVVLTAVLSCLNSGLYTASRMLFVLAARREAPQALLEVNRRRARLRRSCPRPSIGYLCVVAAYVSPDTVFLFLLNSSGAIILFVYLLICRLRSWCCAGSIPPERLRVKMWWYPVLTLLTIAAMVVVLISMGVRDDTRSQLVLSLARLGGGPRRLRDTEPPPAASSRRP